MLLKIEINNIEFSIKSNLSVLEACKYLGINIPRFCYHETLSISGNCRMCVVEVLNSPKPLASCALPVLNNMKIFTNTPLVKKARENVLEILLINHPLDCPICDQGGECDLQDQTKVMGGDRTRFFFSKRAVENKDFGPLIKTVMTRCIHCTRCVRFSSEVAGVESLGTLSRGTFTEIGGYFKSSSYSELYSNVIDLCPVGALTSKPYAFKYRPWELRTFESIDLSDSLGSNIFITVKNKEIIKISPKINFNINKTIISDKARFSFDNYNTPNRIKTSTCLNVASESSLTNSVFFLKKIEKILDAGIRTLILVNEELDLTSLNILKKFSALYDNVSIRLDTSVKIINNNFYKSFNTNKILDLKVKSKICFLISSNIRIENAILNSKIRLKYNLDGCKIVGFALNFLSTFPLTFLNLNISKLLEIFEGKVFFFSKTFIFNKQPLILIGESLAKRGCQIQNLILNIKAIIPSGILLYIRNNSNAVGVDYADINAVSTKDFLASNLVITINIDDNYSFQKYFFKKYFYMVSFNTHYNNFLKKSNIIIPIKTNYEKENIFFNL